MRLGAVDGTGVLGAMTLARSSPCGKSFGFSVTMKEALPISAQAQKALSAGSGEISTVMETSISSASSRSRSITVPIKERRTPRRPKTYLYSAKISSETSHTNIRSFTQSRRKWELEFVGLATRDLNPAIPATNTDVSITPLGTFVRIANADLRQLPLPVAIGPDSCHDFSFRHAGQIPSRRVETPRQLARPARPSPAARLILQHLRTRQLFFQLSSEFPQRKTDLYRFPSSRRL